MPDNIRNYIEKCVKEEESLKYIYCTSTLLEGVNMPFDKLFILDLKKGLSNLTYHQLENLIGRINRYKNIFDLSLFLCSLQNLNRYKILNIKFLFLLITF